MGVQINGTNDTISDSDSGFSLGGTNNRLRLYGATSGYVEISAHATSASNTLTLPTGNGSSGQYLQTNGSGALSWVTPAAGGKLIKYERSSGYKTQESGTSTSWTNTSFTATFTPTSSSNKVLVVVTPIHLTARDGYSTSVDLARTVGGTTTQIGTGVLSVSEGLTSTYDNNYHDVDNTLFYEDSPNTTSQITYRIVWKVQGGSNQRYIFTNSKYSFFHFFEIAS